MSKKPEQRELDEDLEGHNDPDGEVERRGPAVEQELEQPEDEEVANAGVQRTDEADGVASRLDRLAKDAAKVEAPVVVETDSNIVRIIPLTLLRESAGNPRKLFGDLDGLAASLQKIGLAQNLVVRAHPSEKGAFEIIIGHRRFRAAKLAGFAGLQCEVRRVSNDQVLQLQLAENIERKTLHILEEAEGLHRLHTDGKMSAEDIGARVGRSKRWVETRIQLLKLAPEAQDALDKERIEMSTAVHLASIHSHKLQAEAVAAIVKPDEHGRPMSTREAKEYIREHYTTELRGVAFDKKDDMLVPEAGPCTTCPKRTGNNPELLSEYKRADLCLDSACFRAKMDAHWEQVSAKAKEEGKKPVSLQEGRRLLRTGAPGWEGTVVDLSAPCVQDPRKRTWRELLGDAVLKEHVADIRVAPDAQGNRHEMLRKEDAVALAKEAGAKWAQRAEDEIEDRRPTKSQRDKEKSEAEQVNLIENEVLDRAVKAMESGGPVELSAPVLRLMCMGLAQTHRQEVLERRGLKNGLELEGLVEKSSAKALLGLLLELCVSSWIRGGSEISKELRAFAKVFRLDIGAIEKAQAQAAPAEALFKKKKTA